MKIIFYRFLLAVKDFFVYILFQAKRLSIISKYASALISILESSCIGIHIVVLNKDADILISKNKT